MDPSSSCLALGTLRPTLERAGIATDNLYASLLFPRTETPSGFLEQFGSYLFVPALYPDTDIDKLVEGLLQRQYEEASLQRILTDDPEGSCRKTDLRREILRPRILGDIERARLCMDRCFAAAAQPQYDIVGFSLTFETQIPAALALARRLKAARPAIKIAFGGAACLEDQADGLAQSFPAIDAVCHTEGEQVIVPLFRALRGELPMSAVPGIAYRDAAGKLQHTPSPPLLEALDALPIPDYDDYFTQLAASEWHDVGPKVFFETSRGCWWGQKHLCSFCGLNAEGLAFRSKSPERAYEEIVKLYHELPQAKLLQATDNILDMKYFSSVLPRLARLPRLPERPLRIFYEVKSNMKREQVALMAAAGICAVQPGIEAFDNEILGLMDKGCTGLGQVQFLKWTYQEGIKPVYNLILRNPGESAAAYKRMTELLPYIRHLPPPSGLTPMILERFSPYFERPQNYGIRNRRPRSYYVDLYPDKDVDIDRIAYQFDYDHDNHTDAELQRTTREFALRLLREWSANWKPPRACYVDRGDFLLIYDEREDKRVIERLAGVSAELFRYIDSVRSFAAVAQRFAHIDPEFLRARLDHWFHRRWIYRSDEGLYLALMPLLREQPLVLDELLAPRPRDGEKERGRRPADLRLAP
jgi:ribosomal peptide maturation radical SAM protein 1